MNTYNKLSLCFAGCIIINLDEAYYTVTNNNKRLHIRIMVNPLVTDGHYMWYICHFTIDGLEQKIRESTIKIINKIQDAQIIVPLYTDMPNQIKVPDISFEKFTKFVYEWLMAV